MLLVNIINPMLNDDDFELLKNAVNDLVEKDFVDFDSFCDNVYNGRVVVNVNDKMDLIYD